MRCAQCGHYNFIPYHEWPMRMQQALRDVPSKKMRIGVLCHKAKVNYHVALYILVDPTWMMIKDRYGWVTLKEQ